MTVSRKGAHDDIHITITTLRQLGRNELMGSKRS